MNDPNQATPKTAKRLQLLPVLIFLAVAGLFAVALRTGEPTKLPSTLIGKRVPSSSFPQIEGLVANSRPVPGFSDADLAKGHVSLVNFWASWCASCMADHALIADLKAKTNVDVFGVDYKDSAIEARRFLSRYGNPYTAVGADESGRTAIDWGVYGMPETFVINGQGEVVYKHVGAMSEEAIASKIIPAIEAARGPTPPKI